MATLTFTSQKFKSRSCFSIYPTEVKLPLSLKQETEVLLPKEDIIEYVPNTVSYSEAFSQLKTRLGDWKETFNEADLEMSQIAECLTIERTKVPKLLPEMNDIFKAFELTPLSSVRVVILGKEPNSVSDGLSFGSSTVFSSIVENIYNEISSEYPSWVRPQHSDLTKWTSQGVLMLNSCLTSRADDPGYHHKFKLWMPLVYRIIKKIEEVRPNCVYVMWGSDTQKMGQYISDKAIKLESTYPSGVSATRGFFGCNHFKIINDKLIGAGESPIDW